MKINKVKCIEISSLLVLGVCLFSMGYMASSQSWDGRHFIMLYQHMAPSLVRNIASQSENIQAGELAKNAIAGDTDQNRTSPLLKNLEISPISEHNIKVLLGHPFVADLELSNFSLACNVYSFLEIVFVASNISIHGNVPAMTLFGECKTFTQKDEKILQIGPFYIPKQEILDSKTSKLVFISDTQTITFKHLPYSWPKTWLLKQVRFFNQDEKEDQTKGHLIALPLDEGSVTLKL